MMTDLVICNMTAINRDTLAVDQYIFITFPINTYNYLSVPLTLTLFILFLFYLVFFYL